MLAKHAIHLLFRFLFLYKKLVVQQLYLILLIQILIMKVHVQTTFFSIDLIVNF